MKEERAFSGDALPCNSLPFLNRIREILEESGTNGLRGLAGEAEVNVRACMWVLNGQLYGQVATIDLGREYKALCGLAEAVDEGKFGFIKSD